MGSITFAIEQLEYDQLDKEIKRVMKRSAKDVVQIGFMLRQMYDKRLWAQSYDCFDEYLDMELNIDYTMANRFMNINKKYSLGGNSMEIAAKYEQYSQGVLVEMLNMPPKLEAKVTPDMTVREVREIKRQMKPKKEKEPEIQEKENEIIIDGEYREVKEPEEVATSQRNDNADACNVGDTWGPKQCITGLSKYGVCSCCGYEGVQCCSQCGESCNSRCGWLPEQPEVSESVKENIEQDSENGAGVTYGGLTDVRLILEREKKTLNDYLEVGGLPEWTVFRQKTIVGALAAMVCELENAEPEPGEPEQEEFETTKQPILPELKNNDQRKKWLENYKAWGLWYRDEKVDVNYYKYDFEEGSRLVVADYPARRSYWSDENRDEHYYHLLEKNKKGYKKSYDEKYRHTPDSETSLVEFLKNLQKNRK